MLVLSLLLPTFLRSRCSPTIDRMLIIIIASCHPWPIPPSNNVCGAFPPFSLARYLVTKDPDYLWAALWLPLAGCMFDLFDRKIARWRKANSMLGQELDSIADPVCTPPGDPISHPPIRVLDILRRRPWPVGIRDWAVDMVGHRHPDRFRLLRSRTTREVQRHRRPRPKRCLGKVELL
jgi:hypothetical protein